MTEAREFELHVSTEGLAAMLADLAQHREPNEPGSTRRVFSDAHRGGRQWVQQKMVDAGLAVSTDPAGNLIGSRLGRSRRPPIVTGSHSDTVRGGGNYDGALGVVGGIAAARAIAEAGIDLEHDLWVVDFLGEEPNGWGLSCIGSRAVSGGLVADDLARDNGSGVTLRDALQNFGIEPDSALTARWPILHSFVELHIEQGPVLEASGASIGVVTGIVGVHRMLVEIFGRRDHAGTMPMDLRIDASCAAAEFVLAVESSASDGLGVATTGRFEIEPGAINVVPDLARVWVELRSIEPTWLANRDEALRKAAQEVAARRGCRCQIQSLSNEGPTIMHPDVRAAITAAARVSVVDLASGAEHDARQIARIARTGMIFVPSKDGRSHTPEEWTSPLDCVTGVETLARTLVRLDRTTFESFSDFHPSS